MITFYRLLSAMLLLVMASTAMAYDFMVDDLAYSINDDGSTATVTWTVYNNYGNYSGLTEANIPPSVTHNGITYSVTAIAECAFEYATSMTSVTIPSSVTTIGDWAFAGCRKLTGAVIPRSVTTVGYDAFIMCPALNSLAVEAGNPLYDSRYGCNAIISTADNTLLVGCNSTVIPTGVTMIGEDAFYGSGITAIDIPSTVTKIDLLAFYESMALTTVRIPASVVEIGEYAFQRCSALESITIDSANPVYDSRDNCNAIISTETNTMLYGSNNTVIPNTVTRIGEFCFSTMKSLKSLYIPASVESIGWSIASNCPSLESIVVDENNPYNYSSPDGCNAIIYADRYLLVGCKNTVVPQSVTNIYSYAFSGCTGLTELTLPEGNNDFQIGYAAFSDCTSLRRINIPSTTTIISDYAFTDCTALERITSGISDVSAVTMGKYVFYNVPTSTCILEVPAGTVEMYRNAQYWKNFTNIVEHVDGLLGDVDGNGEVDGNDLNTLINIILGKADASSYNANVDGQGGVDGSDINALINILLGKN